MRSTYAMLVALSLTVLCLAMSWTPFTDDAPAAVPKPAHVQAAAVPVAVIASLPDEVSNGTWQYLDAKNSTYANGTIDLYEWRIELRGVLKSLLYEVGNRYIFRQLGLYKITLTVTTNDSKTATAFTAVYSIPDSDADLMPDWWENYYFHGLGENGEGDFDSDKYSNLQEYASGTDPTSKDPRPSLMTMIRQNWYYLPAAAAVIVIAILIMYPRLKKRRKQVVKKQIEAAIEIEKALEE